MFAPKKRFLRDVSFLSSSGMEPESLFQERSRMIKFLKFPIDTGIEPVRLLLYKDSSLSELSFLSWWGMDPVMLFSWRSNMRRLVSWHNSDGILPERWLTDKLRWISLERFPKREGMVPKSTLWLRLSKFIWQEVRCKWFKCWRINEVMCSHREAEHQAERQSTEAEYWWIHSTSDTTCSLVLD